MPDPVPSLSSLRQEIDAIDDSIHDLLMRRAEIVQRVAGLGRVGKIPFRPGREADIITRLLARHTGPLARRALVRWWREIYAAYIGIETAFTIAVAEPAGPGGEYAAVAREQFGALTPLRLHASAGQVIDDVSMGRATAGVLPMPSGADWWPDLLKRDGARVHIVERLPFWSTRPEGAPTAEAFVIAVALADPSTSDRSVLLAEQNDPDVTGNVVARCTAGILFEVAGYVGSDDPRLLGHYAVPVAA